MAFIKHAEHKLLTLSTVNLQHGGGRRGRGVREKKKKSNETEGMVRW